jgi:hypothetical protein
MANGVPINTRQKARKQKEAFAGALGFMMMLFLQFYSRSPRRFLCPAVRTARTPTFRFYCREPERLQSRPLLRLNHHLLHFSWVLHFSVGAATGVQDSRSNSSTYYYYFDSPPLFFLFLYSSFSDFSQTNRPLSLFLGGSDHVPFLPP